MATAVDVVEWESTISLGVEKSVYDAYRDGGAAGRRLPCDVIFFFADGSRLSRRTAQRKVVVDSRRVLGFRDGRYYPVRRTRATETTIALDGTQAVVKAVHRLIYFCDDGARIAYDKEETENGVRYRLTGETEYPPTSSYEHIVERERALMRRVADRVGAVTPDRLTLSEIFSCVAPKVQTWTCFDPRRRFRWAFKWNGMKAKLIYLNGLVYVWPDAGEIRTCRYAGDLTCVERMCLQVELMDDRVVVVEVIAVAFHGKIYTSEPSTNVAILDHLAGTLPADATVDGQPLVVQKFHGPPLPKHFDDSGHDGFIIVQGELTIKWKPPTVDVKCTGPCEYTVGSENRTVIINLPRLDSDTEELEGIKGCIYEMSSNYRILRRRVDRLTCSTTREYTVFLESVRLLNLSTRAAAATNTSSSSSSATVSDTTTTTLGTICK